jgi:hypothetical protein
MAKRYCNKHFHDRSPIKDQYGEKQERLLAELRPYATAIETQLKGEKPFNGMRTWIPIYHPDNNLFSAMISQGKSVYHSGFGKFMDVVAMNAKEVVLSNDGHIRTFVISNPSAAESNAWLKPDLEALIKQKIYRKEHLYLCQEVPSQEIISKYFNHK